TGKILYRYKNQELRDYFAEATSQGVLDGTAVSALVVDFGMRILGTTTRAESFSEHRGLRGSAARLFHQAYQGCGAGCTGLSAEVHHHISNLLYFSICPKSFTLLCARTAYGRLEHYWVL